MAPDELVRLCRKLRVSPIAKEDALVSVSYEFFDRDTEALPSSLRDELKTLMDEVRAVVPSDFSVSLTFAFDGVRVATDLEDGNSGTIGMGGGGFFSSRKSMLKKLRTTDWDEVRTHSMQQMDVFDEMVNDADDLPANIPSSAAAAKKWQPQIDAAVASVRQSKPIPEFTLLAVQDIAGLEVSHYPTKDRLIGNVANCMTCHYDILAVLERGVAWSYPEIEAMKLEAVEGLGPISRAKAERRL